MMTTQSTEIDPMPWSMPVFIRNQFHHLDRFIVVNLETMVAVEGHYNEKRAQHAAAGLTDYNEKNDHAERYGVYPLPARLHNQPPSDWH